MPKIFHVLVTVDLKKLGEQDEKRTKFNEHLDSNGWVKMDGVTTTWKAKFGQYDTPQQVEPAIRKWITQAATLAGINAYSYAYMVGESEPKTG